MIPSHKLFGLFILVGAIAANTACATKIRTITANVGTEQGMYVGYWEGTCSMGCSIGDGHAMFCKLNPDNTLNCSEQTEVSALLSRKQSK